MNVHVASSLMPALHCGFTYTLYLFGVRISGPGFWEKMKLIWSIDVERWRFLFGCESSREYASFENLAFSKVKCFLALPFKEPSEQSFLCCFEFRCRHIGTSNRPFPYFFQAESYLIFCKIQGKGLYILSFSFPLP